MIRRATVVLGPHSHPGQAAHPGQPDIFPQQGRGAGRRIPVVFRQPVALRVMHRMDGLPGLRQTAHHLLAKGVVDIFGLHHTVDEKALHPACVVVGIAETPAGLVVIGDIARRVIGQAAGAPCAKRDALQPVLKLQQLAETY